MILYSSLVPYPLSCQSKLITALYLFFFFFGVEFIVYGGVVTYMRHYFIYALRWAPSAPLSLSPHKHRQRPTLWWHPLTAQQ